MSVKALMDSGTTRQFINIKYVQQRTYDATSSREILVYNMDWTPNKAGYCHNLFPELRSHRIH